MQERCRNNSMLYLAITDHVTVMRKQFGFGWRLAGAPLIGRGVCSFLCVVQIDHIFSGLTTFSGF